jgi:hypothetical protein
MLFKFLATVPGQSGHVGKKSVIKRIAFVKVVCPCLKKRKMFWNPWTSNEVQKVALLNVRINVIKQND